MAFPTTARHGVLVPDVVTEVVITARSRGIFITNRAGGAKYEMWAKLDGTDPAIEGDDSILVTSDLGNRTFAASGSTSVRLISSFPVPYSVETY